MPYCTNSQGPKLQTCVFLRVENKERLPFLNMRPTHTTENSLVHPRLVVWRERGLRVQARSPHAHPHSSPYGYPNQTRARRRLMTLACVSCQISAHSGATKKPPQCHATPVPLFVPSRRSPSRATHEVPSHSPDSLPSTNFCSRLFQPSHHLPLLLWPYRSQLHVAGRRRRAAAAAAARATAGQR